MQRRTTEKAPLNKQQTLQMCRNFIN